MKEAPKDEEKSEETLLEELEMHTLHGLVHTVKVPVGDGLPPAACKFLYLTNQQLQYFPDASFPALREELEIGSPRLVIRLLPSCCGKAWWSFFPNYSQRWPAKRVPECSEEEMQEKEKQILLLAKEVLLPLACRTQALVIGQDACSLTHAFVAAARPEQNRWGDNCPFRLLIFARAPMVSTKASMPPSIASIFFEKARKAREVMGEGGAMPEALENRFGSDKAFHPQGDLFPGHYALVLFENLDFTGSRHGPGGRIRDDAMVHFQGKFLRQMSHVPVVGLHTHGCSQLETSFKMNIASLAAHVSMGFPTLLIDSRTRDRALEAGHSSNQDDIALDKDQKKGDEESDDNKEKTKDKQKTLTETAEELRAFGDKLNESGVADWYHISALARMKKSINELILLETSTTSVAQKQKNLWLCEAIDHLREQRAAERSGGGDMATQQGQGKQGLAKLGANLIMDYAYHQSSWEARHSLDRCQAARRKIEEQTPTWKEFREAVQDGWPALRACMKKESKGLERFAEKNASWCVLKKVPPKPPPNLAQRQFGFIYLEIKEWGEVQSAGQETEMLDHARKELLALIDKDYEKEADNINRLKGRLMAKERWLWVYEVLQASHVRVASLHDSKMCKRKLAEIAKIDYLPSSNSYEALILLRRAWTLHDVYMVTADSYKSVTKFAYAINLAIQMGIIIVVTLEFAITLDDFELWKVGKKYLLLMLSLLATLLASFVNFIKPQRKWHGLRGTAMRLESEIWQFRARMGPYARSATHVSLREREERRAEEEFAARIIAFTEEARKQALLGMTSFFARAPTVADNVEYPGRGGRRPGMRPFWCCAVRCLSFGGFRDFERHNQGVKGGKFEDGEDNHHSPTTADDYITHRIVKRRDFYRRRIPRVSRWYGTTQVILIMSTVTNSLVSALVEAGGWAAMISSFSSIAMAWAGFLDLDRKLDRYSNLSRNLDDTISWWLSLKTDERENTDNIGRLVKNAEEVIVGEVDDWLATAVSLSRSMAKGSDKAHGADQQR